MNNSTAVSNVIPFRSAKLLLVDQAGEPYVPMKPVVEGMGLDWGTQFRKLQAGRFNSVIVMMTTTGTDGKSYEMSCLPLRKLAGWLMSIHASKVRPELREGVIAYQNECDDALWSYWNQGHAVNHRSAGQSLTLIGQTIGTDGFHMLGSIVKGKVTGLPVAARRRAISKIWAQTHAAFGVRSAEDIPADQLDSVRNFIAAYAIEGEFLEKEKSGLPDLSIPPDASLVQRWLLSRGPDGKPRIKEIPIDACVMSIPDFLTKINETNGLCLTRTELFDFAIASITQLRRRVID